MASVPTLFEGKWPSVIQTNISVSNSVVTVSDTAGFHPKQKVTLSAIGQPPEDFTVYRVLSNTQLELVPYGQVGAGQDQSVQNPTEFNGGVLSFSEDVRNKIGYDIVLRAVYSDEPAVALRNVLVDKYGAYWDDENPFPIAFDGTVSIGDVHILGPSGTTMQVNSDGSINVNLVETPASGNIVRSVYGQVSAVVNGATTTLVSYTVPPATTAVLQRANASGENIARYDVVYNSSLFDTRRTYFGSPLTTDFDYTTGNSQGLLLNSGDTVLVQVLHNRPLPGTFNARIQVLEIP